jgi:NitT/TauT family transport system substrate-binding protein
MQNSFKGLHRSYILSILEYDNFCGIIINKLFTDVRCIKRRSCRMKKITALILIVALFTLMFTGCIPKAQTEQPKPEKKLEDKSENKEDIPEETEKIALRSVVLSGTTAMSMAKILKEKPAIFKSEIEHEIIKAPDLMAAKIISGEADFAVIPTNLAAKLYNKGVPYKLAASTVWGVLYVTSSENIDGWEGLKGKEIYTIGKGLTPDILFRYLLKENGLDPEKDVKLIYLPSPQELAQTLISEKGKVGIVPEPMLTAVLMKNQNFNIYIDLQEEWKKTTGIDSYPQTSLIIKNEIIEKYPNIIDEFLTKYEESINWVNENKADAGEVIETLNIGLKAKIAEKSIPGSNLKYVDAQEARPAVEKFLKVLMDFSADSIGGKLPDENFYLQR